MNKGLVGFYEREKNKQWLFIYAMAIQDIKIAKKYLEVLRVNKLVADLREANVIALYIIYGRIFSKNHDLPKLTLKDLHCALTEEEEGLHEALMNCRNKIFAHRDLSINRLEISLDSNGKLDAQPTYSTVLIEQDYNTLCSLFDKLLSAADNKKKELLQKLYAEEDGYKIVNPNAYVVIGYNSNLWECKYEQTELGTSKRAYPHE